MPMCPSSRLLEVRPLGSGLATVKRYFLPFSSYAIPRDKAWPRDIFLLLALVTFPRIRPDPKDASNLEGIVDLFLLIR